MSTMHWILNLALLAWVLLRNVGSRPLNRSAFTVPLIIVGVAAATFLRNVPTAGHDVTLEILFAAIGLGLGAIATALTTLRPVGDQIVVTAGAAFAGLWLVVIGGRIAFAQWATGPGSHTVGQFSREHLITGSDAWTAAFVLMALAMVLSRLLTTAARAAAMRHRLQLSAPATVQA